MDERNKHTLIMILTTVSVAILLLGVGFYISTVESHRLTIYCDKLYGVGGWVMNETTGTGECRAYMGQCWHCINRSDTNGI